jgi:hypothetical protein
LQTCAAWSIADLTGRFVTSDEEVLDIGVIIDPTTLRHVGPTKTTEHPSQALTKNAERREKFRRIGAEISKLSATDIAWRDRLGDHVFEPHTEPVDSFAVTSKLGNGKTRGSRGPAMKTLQFRRAVRMK